MPPLLIIYQHTLKAAAFWLLQLPHTADWLRRFPQADNSKTENFRNYALMA
jgi:hypothetical protein